MGLQRYLAMTAAEFSALDQKPAGIAWMACHFSSYGAGLSNLPRELPEGSMVIINDRTPPQGHDPALITKQLQQLAENENVSRFLLDFQRGNDGEIMRLSETLVRELGKPVGVSQWYAGNLECPVFLSCPSPHQGLRECLASWEGREVWLEAALETERAVVTGTGCRFEWVKDTGLSEPIFTDDALHCRYHTQVLEDRVIFTMERRKEELQALLEQAQTLGVQTVIGLYQQLGIDFLPL